MTDVVTVRKKPVEHEAILYTGKNCAEVALFTSTDWDDPCYCDGNEVWLVDTLHGMVEAKPGTWIIKGERDCWPVDAEQFADTYEVVLPSPVTSKLVRKPAMETRWSAVRREWNLLIRRPFYLNLRLGVKQNALWVGRSNWGAFHTVFNWMRAEKESF